MNTLLLAKIGTLVLALAMLVFSILRHKKEPGQLHRARTRIYAALSIAAVVLVFIHAMSPYSIEYIAGYTLVGILVVYGVSVHLRSKKLGGDK